MKNEVFEVDSKHSSSNVRQNFIVYKNSKRKNKKNEITASKQTSSKEISFNKENQSNQFLQQFSILQQIFCYESNMEVRTQL